MVYHENAAGELVGTHYCIAANQPEIELAYRAEGIFFFELSPDDQNVGEGELHKARVHADGPRRG